MIYGEYKLEAAMPLGTLMDQLSLRSIDRLAQVACGDEAGYPKRTGPALVKLFNKLGCNAHYGSNFPPRYTFAVERIRELNGHTAIVSLIEQLFNPLSFAEVDSVKVDVDRAIRDINEYLTRDGFEVVVEGDRAKVRTSAGATVKIDPVPVSPASREFVEEHVKKCEDKLREGDFAGAITNARSLCEEVLRDIESGYSGNTKYDGDLGKLSKRVFELLGLRESGSEDQGIRQVIGSLSGMVGGLAQASNSMGDRHGGHRAIPQKHQAQLAVNAANTLCTFLLEVNITVGEPPL